MKSFNDQTYFCVNERVLLGLYGEELSGGENVQVGFFSMWEWSGMECPGVNSPYEDFVPGRTVRGGIYRSSPTIPFIHEWDINWEVFFYITLQCYYLKELMCIIISRKDYILYKLSIVSSKIYTISFNGHELSEQICLTSGAVKVIEINILKWCLPTCWS